MTNNPLITFLNTGIAHLENEHDTIDLVQQLRLNGYPRMEELQLDLETFMVWVED